MRLFIPLLVSLTLAPAAWAQDECAGVERDLSAIERHLFQASLEGCQALTVESLGLTGATPAQEQLLRDIRCSTLANVDERLAQVEGALLVEDGLRELTTQVVAQQQTLAGIAQWRPQEHQLADRFLRDVSLAALIENLHTSNLSAALKATPAQGNWLERARRLCEAPANREVGFCLTLSRLPGSVSLESEFGAFVTGLPAEGLTEAMAAQLSVSGKVGDTTVRSFDRLREELARGGLDGFLRNGRATPEQVRLVRGLQLSPGPAEGPLASLLNRMQATRAQMQVGGAVAHFRRTSQDAAARHRARARGRWASLWAAQGEGATPCTGLAGEAFITCVEENYTKIRGPSESPNIRIKETIVSGTRLAVTMDRMAQTCTTDGALANLVAGQRPVGCEALDVSGADAGKRELLTAIREKFREQEALWLRFRAKAIDDARDCAEVHTDPGAVGCASAAVLSINDVLTLSFDTLTVVDEGLRASDTSEFGTAECAGQAQLPAELSAMCVRLYRPRREARAETPDEAPFRRDDIRPSDPDRRPEVRDAVQSAISEVLGAWRQSNQTPTLPWWSTPQQQQRIPAYSSPSTSNCWSYSACALSAGYANGLGARFPVNTYHLTGTGTFGSRGLDTPKNLSSQFFPGANGAF